MIRTTTYPSVLEEPVLRKFGVIGIHADRDLANVLCLCVQSFKLGVVQSIATPFRMYPGMIEDLVYILTREISGQLVQEVA